VGVVRASWRAFGLVLLLTFGGTGSVGLAASSSQRITFYFGLKRPEAQARAAFFAVQQPGSRSYRRFLSVRRVAAGYGASPITRSRFIRAAARQALSARVDRSGVFARVTGTVSQFEQVFAVHIHSQFNNDVLATGYFVPGQGRLRLPADMRSLVQDVVPSFTRSTPPPPGMDVLAPAARDRAPRRTGMWVRGCPKAKATGAFSFAQVRHAYGIDRLGAGRGASVAILNVGEGVSGQDVADNARCFGYPRLASRTLLTDGQAHRFAQGTFEPEEDLALVRGMAPGLRSITFAQAWPAAELWFLGASEVLNARALPDSFSISYGECERQMRGRGSTPTTRAGANMMDSLLLRLGLAGVGSYASAGDFGSTCNGQPFTGVAWPSSSPFVTAVGGTQLTLSRANQRTSEVVWNDLRWLSANNGGGAGGGGFSVASARPPFQHGLGLPGSARTTPDVSADATLFPGWPVVLGGNWVPDGGTSASAPLVASAMAIVSSDQVRSHRPPVGPADGLFYTLVRAGPGTMFDVVSGANGYLRKVPARRAKRGYDLASGLGVPQFARLAARLPRPAR
jgi:Pro-kumamolisin, activation domain